MGRMHVGPVADLPPGEHKIVSHGEIEIGVFNVDGRFRAYRNRCPHQLGPACTGIVTGTLMPAGDSDWRLEWALEGRVLLCPWHQLEFDIETGERICGRGERLRNYNVEEAEGELYINV